MELEKIDVSYDLPMEEIKTRFLSALVEKYQSIMLFLPFLECPVEEKLAEAIIERPFRWTDIVDGVLLSVDLFLVESHVDPEVPEEKQPFFTFSDKDFISKDMRLKAPAGQELSLFPASKYSITYFRHYRHDSHGLEIVSSRTVVFAQDPLLASSWLLPLWTVDTKGSVRGKSCLLVLQLAGLPKGDQPTRATFGGIIDVWGPSLRGSRSKS
ncbi:hypothetical protein N7504_007043 [Penicillium tannophilum]|nr:hypothetical protein N7504_007043 [Penicillium tannophilum]